MSGHSKWSQIKRQKGVSDVKRGLVFTKIANAITIAVKQGGGIGDPEQNFRLRLTIEKAKSANMPKENVQRAIEKGQGKGGKGDFYEVVYEGFGPGGVVFIVEAATDNKLRTTSEIKNFFEKNNVNLATPGAVSYQFQIKGLINVKKEGKTVDEVFLIAADAGAEDVEDAGNEVLVYTKPEELAKIKDDLIKNGLSVESFELTKNPITTVEVNNKEIAAKILSFIEKVEGMDDVQKVYSNFDIPEDIMFQINL
ncbi:MAG: YebC/PmpR family DNA-binding transcriptional regulator [Candidatus Levybacteria bacterium]|nr:YebC/PmpR family DNA-binding transcriptional regulator [Candidatus Levybacteria bacterium]